MTDPLGLLLTLVGLFIVAGATLYKMAQELAEVLSHVIEPLRQHHRRKHRQQHP